MRTINKHSKPPSGFTLIELLVVILIIGLLLTFVLAASNASVESARVRATQSLITKLSVGLEDRLDALLAIQPQVTGAHSFLASVNNPSGPLPTFPAGMTPLPWGLQSPQRAQVIARLDQVRAEFPDVFFIDPAVANGGSKGLYPIRFGGLPYPDPSDASAPLINYVLPIGNNSALYLPNSAYTPGGPITNPGPGGFIPGVTSPTGTGINGASYFAAAALHKLIGYTPKGCDGIDNNNDGTVDEYLEGISDPNENSGGNAEAVAKIDTFLQNHTHKTARAEMLYAILVEGAGPLGSIFSAKDFTNGEIKDTDNDGVPEFVDAWGEPLQFFRWPVAHRSETQKGDGLYGGFEARQLNPLDPNSQLTALPWWGVNAGSSPSEMSPKCLAIQNFFGPLYDTYWVSGVSPQPSAWDRSGVSGRRAYATKFLVVSGGPDGEVGIPRISDFEIKNTSRFTSHELARSVTGTITQSGGTTTIVPGESWALRLDGNNLPPWVLTPYEPSLGVDIDYALDDISNQNIQTKSGGF